MLAKVVNLLSLLCCLGYAAGAQNVLTYKHQTLPVITESDISTGAEVLLESHQRLKDKKIGLVTNHTSLVNNSHLVDTLLSLGYDVSIVFAPEHGFRGTADAGATVKSGLDEKTGLPIISLYGSNKKPKPSQLEGIELVIFDIQDVGVRYYTYISTMHYVMEACAENNIDFMVLDRPNPNGFYVDGPVLEPNYESFVGMHPIPLVHGLTVGELAMMINQEGWLEKGVRCNLEVVKCKGYAHNQLYQLDINPSPNLPNMTSIYLYPGLGIFEGTVISVGRGTDHPFQAIGHPSLEVGDFYFTPKPTPGAMSPRYNGEECRGFDLTGMNTQFAEEFKGMYLNWIITAYNNYPNKDKFFYKSGFFELLVGSRTLREQLQAGKSEDEIRDSWQPKLDEYRALRKRYLLYPDEL